MDAVAYETTHILPNSDPFVQDSGAIYGLFKVQLLAGYGCDPTHSRNRIILIAAGSSEIL